MRSDVTQKKGGELTPPFYANFNTTFDSRTILQRYSYIPVDFVKCVVIGKKAEDFYSLNIGEPHRILEGDEIKEEKLKHHNMILQIYPSGRIQFSGSLHKFINDGEHNYNRFTEVDFYRSIEKMNRVFKLQPKDLIIEQLEYGVNIAPPIDTDIILHGLMMHKGKEFEQVIKKSSGHYHQCVHDDYILKIYNKALQYDLKRDVLRIEKKQKRWSKYNPDLKTLEDFIAVDKKCFFEDLTRLWDEVLFVDVQSISGVWSKYQSIHFWREIKPKSRTTLKRHRDRLKALNQLGGVNTQLEVQKAIKDEILRCQKPKRIKRCQVTGVAIDTQREDSYLLSHTGLWNLYKYNIEEFNRIKSVLLPRRWENASIKVQIRETAHIIRSRANYYQKRFNNQFNLFEGVTNYGFRYTGNPLPFN